MPLSHVLAISNRTGRGLIAGRRLSVRGGYHLLSDRASGNSMDVPVSGSAYVEAQIPTMNARPD